MRYINKQAQEVSLRHFGNRIFIRGLIEVSNCCRNNCYYCGIQGSNPNANRYRLSKEEILSACENGYQLGYRSFVLQGGEDPHYTDEVMVPIVTEIINLEYSMVGTSVSTSPLIFVIAALFTILTVFISTRKPAKNGGKDFSSGGDPLHRAERL